MHPAELIGQWDSAPYNFGAMETTELALLPDGRGWTRLQNAAGADDVRRLNWDCPKPGVLELRYTLLVSDGRARHDDEFVRAQCTLLTDTPPPSSTSVEALHLSVLVDFARQFGLVRREVSIADDPTAQLAPYE